MSVAVDVAAEKLMRIGEVAELTGTTPRTIRYWEEIGLLPGSTGLRHAAAGFRGRGGRLA